MMLAVAETVAEIPSRSKCAWLRGSFTRATTLLTPYFSRASWQMIRLSSSSPVTATTTSGGLAIPARSSTWISVASPSCTWCSNSTSSWSYRSRRCSISVTSWPWPSRRRLRPRFAPIFPPPAIRTYTALRRYRLAQGDLALTRRLQQVVDRRLGRADDPQPEPAVEVGPGRVEHAHDD